MGGGGGGLTKGWRRAPMQHCPLNPYRPLVGWGVGQSFLQGEVRVRVQGWVGGWAVGGTPPPPGDPELYSMRLGRGLGLNLGWVWSGESSQWSGSGDTDQDSEGVRAAESTGRPGPRGDGPGGVPGGRGGRGAGRLLRRGGGGKSLYTKMAQSDCPCCKFRFFPQWSLWSWGGAGGLVVIVLKTSPGGGGGDRHAPPSQQGVDKTMAQLGEPGRSLTEKEEKSVPVHSFPKKVCRHTVCWRWAVSGWWLATGSWWRLVVVGGGWWLMAVGSGWQLAVGGGWRLVAVGGWWRLAVGGGWWLAVDGPLGRSLRAVLNKKKI